MIKSDVFVFATGELMQDACVTTIKERENYREFLQKKEKAQEKYFSTKQTIKSNGDFVWVHYKVNEALNLGVSPSVMTRLFYLSTFIGYDNKLKLSNQVSIKHVDLQKILKISQRSVVDFWAETTKLKLIIKKKNGLFLNPNVFSKGSVSKDTDMLHMRLYVDNVRALYENASAREHKFLSYLFQAIPFVNVDYNMLCFNPTEKNFDNIELMSLAEYCEIIGYSSANNRRLKALMKNLYLNGLPVFNFVKSDYGKFCYISPNIFYAGNQRYEAKILGEFDKDENNT